MSDFNIGQLQLYDRTMLKYRKLTRKEDDEDDEEKGKNFLYCLFFPLVSSFLT